MKRKLFDAVVQLDSYNTILSSYMELHENILEMTHASLLVDKMQEQINTMKEFLITTKFNLLLWRILQH